MKHLLVLSIGPVQEFIAAARRTRDLWFGSEMLSEVSRAAASSIGQDRLIFPSSTGSDSAPNVANVILAELEDGEDPQAFAELARTAAVNRWLKYAGQARDIASSVVNQRRWNTQIADVLEFYAAWAPLPNEEAYTEARQQVMRLMAGRKACRNFDPGAGEAGVPKSLQVGSAAAPIRRGLKQGHELLGLAQGDLAGCRALDHHRRKRHQVRRRLRRPQDQLHRAIPRSANREQPIHAQLERHHVALAHPNRRIA